MFSRLQFACLSMIVFFPVFERSVNAQEPRGIVRTFAVITFEPVDFTSTDSVLIKVEKSDRSIAIKEYVDESDPGMDGSLWLTGAVSAMYITTGEGRTSAGTFYWLLSEETPEPPPVGSVAMIGAEAEIHQEVIGHVRLNTYGELVPTSYEYEPVMILVTARFSK